MVSMTPFPMADRCAGGALIASSSSDLREQVLQSLNGRWRPVQHAVGGADALVKLATGAWQVLFLDRRLPDLDSAELIAIVQRRFPGIEVVLLDGDAGFEASGQKYQKSGPRGCEEKEIKEEREEVAEYPPLPGMIGRSEAMQRVYRLAQLVAPRTDRKSVV